MTTTHLFVELLVIGLGTLAALVLFMIGCGGTGWLPDQCSYLATAVPLLGFAYVLGIVTDRLADMMLEGWASRLRATCFEGKTDYFKYRRILKMEAPSLWTDIEYTRSRLRICRGWVLNSLLLSFAAPYACVRLSPGCADVALLVLAPLLFGVLCLLCWRRMSLMSFRKIHRQAPFVWKWKGMTTRLEAVGGIGRASAETSPNDLQEGED